MSSELATDPRDLIYNDRFRRQSFSSRDSKTEDFELLLSAIYPICGIKLGRNSNDRGWLEVYGSIAQSDTSDTVVIRHIVHDEIESIFESKSTDASTAPFDISAAVATIRAHFSLQIKELARMLGVQRPTIYAWLRGEAKPQPENRSRISQVLRLVNHWRQLGGRPLDDLVRSHLDDQGRSLVDLLSENPLDEDCINAHLSRLARAKPGRPVSLSKIAEKAGIDLSRVLKSDLEFDVLTGRSFDEE